MAGSQEYPFHAKTYDNQVFQLHFSFRPNGTSALSLLKGDGISAAARTGVGVYTVTLADTDWVSFVNANIQYMVGAEDTIIQLTSFVASTGVLTFTILTAGSAADVTSASTSEIIYGTIWVTM